MKQKLLNFLCLTLAACGAAQVLLLSETSQKKLNKNEVVYLNIMLNIKGAEYEQESPIKLPDLSKFDIMGISTSQNVIQRGNEEVYQTILQVGLLPHKAGRVKIGSALVQVNGKMYKSEPFDLLVNANEVKKPNAYACDQNADMSIELSQKNLYQNQPTVAHVKLNAKCLTGLRKVSDIKAKSDENVQIFPIENKENTIEEIKKNGEKVLSQIKSKFVCIPKKSGFINIAPMINAQNANINNNAVSIKVKNLPPAPQGFKNAVGDFKIALNSNKTDVKANETFELTLKISGKGNIHNLELPEILQSPNYKVFSASQQRQVSSINGEVSGEVQANFVLMALKDAPFEVKFEPLNFFNPETNTYEQSQIAPLKIGDEHSGENQKEENTTAPAQNLQQPSGTVEHVLHNAPQHESALSWWPIVIAFCLILLLILILRKAIFGRKKNENTAQTFQNNELVPIIPEVEIVNETPMMAAPSPWELLSQAQEANDKEKFFEIYFDYYKSIKLQDFGMAQQAQIEEFHQKMNVEKYSPFVSQDNLQAYLHELKLILG